DYLIKPVNPNQVLLSIKKNLHKQEIYDEVTTTDYRKEFGSITMSFTDARTIEDWINIYKKLTNWDIQLSDLRDESVKEILEYQKNEANSEFAKFIKREYKEWFKPKTLSKPIMSHTLFRNSVIPVVDKNEKSVFLLIDNFRYDQWRAISSLLRGHYDVAQDDFYCAILPTATQYARNAIFAGLMPLAIDKLMPQQWLNDNEEGGKNQFEEQFFKRLLSQTGKT
ncbi:MAG: PglZ domain-containing protein, partial [Rikenellaceae bacterium]